MHVQTEACCNSYMQIFKIDFNFPTTLEPCTQPLHINPQRTPTTERNDGIVNTDTGVILV